MSKRKLILVSAIALVLVSLFGCIKTEKENAPIAESHSEENKETESEPEATLPARSFTGDVEEAAIQAAVYGYYDESFRALSMLSDPDYEGILEPGSLCAHNKPMVFHEILDHKMKDESVSLEQLKEQCAVLPFQIDFLVYRIQGADAEVRTIVSGDQGKAYPFFFSFGENIFKLHQSDESWLIYEHRYGGYWYETYERHWYGQDSQANDNDPVEDTEEDEMKSRPLFLDGTYLAYWSPEEIGEKPEVGAYDVYKRGSAPFFRLEPGHILAFLFFAKLSEDGTSTYSWGLDSTYKQIEYNETCAISVFGAPSDEQALFTGISDGTITELKIFVNGGITTRIEAN